MTEATRALVRAAAALAVADRASLAAALGDAQHAAGVAATEEMLLQSYLFLGYPRTLQGLMLWRELSGVAAPPEPSRDAAVWPERGERICRMVYGEQYERLRANVARLHPDLEQWMVQEGYGKVLGRPGLDLRTRELCIVAMLAVQDAPAQLYSHLRGALNAGVPSGQVEEALTYAVQGAGEARRAAAREVWSQVLARRTERDTVTGD